MAKFHVDIRDYKPAELQEIVQLNINEYQTNNEFGNLSRNEKFEKARWWFDTSLLQWHINILKKCRGGIILAIYDNQIIGELDYAMSLDIDKRGTYERIHIIWLLVDKKFRKKKVATTLVNHLKMKYTEIPINVEAEDSRSFHLYSQLGIEQTKIENWILAKKKFNHTSISNSINYSLSDYKTVISFLNNESVIILGRYYCPEFDLQQLSNSDEPHEFIWGEMKEAEIYHFFTDNIEVLSIMTQYLRIFIKNLTTKDVSKSELKSIFQDIHKILFSYGFEDIYLQIYSESESIVNLIKEVGYKKSEEDILFRL